MKLELMTADKLKICLDTQDLVKYNITFSSLDYKSKKTRDIFWEIINVAKSETGFNPNGSRLLIEAFPDITGGISLYVSKLGKSSNVPIEKGYTYDKEKELNKKTNLLFCFENSDDLLESCYLFKNLECRVIDSSLYEYLGKFYLKLHLTKSNEKEALSAKRFILSLTEYGKLITNEISECYLNEHANIIIKESAINIILEKLNA